MSNDSLSSWVQSKFQPLYSIHSQGDNNTLSKDMFLPAFTQVFADSPQITKAFEAVTADDFLQRLTESAFASTNNIVEFKDVIEVPASDDKPHDAGVVAGTVVITHTSRIRIRVAAAKSFETLVFNAKIEQAPVNGEDKRRITQFVYTSASKAAPISLGPSMPVQPPARE